MSILFTIVQSTQLIKVQWKDQSHGISYHCMNITFNVFMDHKNNKYKKSKDMHGNGNK